MRRPKAAINAAKALRETLDVYYPQKERVWIYSSINTKEYAKVMEILFRNEDIIILTKSNSEAAVPPELLQESLQKNNSCKMKMKMKIYLTTNIQEAINTYSDLMSDKTLGIMAGSLYSIGDFFK